MNNETQMFCGDSAEELLKLKDNSVDMLCSDPPYGYSFMNKGWDKVLPDTQIWRECYRVLKPGAFITIMAAPRTDVLWRISRDLEESGFDLSFSNIEWVYHSGFPKATDISKSIDKRFDAEREVKDKVVLPYKDKNRSPLKTEDGWNDNSMKAEFDITAPATDLAKKYEGSKAGFQPKPAREIIIVGMKPFEEGSYIDKVLNFEALPDNIKMTYPLIQTPKPAKKEKDFGMRGEEKKKPQRDEGQEKFNVPQKNRPTTAKNNHPTVKPIKLMSYLITLFTRPGDWVLDPFGGSGTTGLACKLLDRNHIYIDFTQEYYDIAEERFNVSKQDLKKLLKEKISNGQQELF
ncbi:AdoMet_MTases domain containing protein [uncultured Caudovirales phage]|uniref:AdoMet_MTases domain containing protein n=1 Tax=uncultured Caudovirales phage TaxID=2100421 RepID=A0A6J5M3W7_9CAUD|nr:AdoMet_MTases domain containing protein [uncultured Caudovirales phage]